MQDQTETPLTERKVGRGGLTSDAGGSESASNAAVPTDLEAELANLRLLIRRQDAVVERLLSERAVSGIGGATVAEAVPPATKRKRSTRRGLLTQLAAGAAGVATAAVYGTTKAGTANAEAYGTLVGPSNTQAGIMGFPNGITPITSAQTSAIGGVWGQYDNNPPPPAANAGVIGISNIAAGVLGQSNSYVGVYGRSSQSFGVWGVSPTNIAVNGESTTGYGVRGSSSSNHGVHGQSGSSYGVFGGSGSSFGVMGESASSHGVYGTTNAAGGFAGVHGESFNPSGIGVWGRNPSGGIGVQGSGSSGPGVLGNSTSGPGVHGASVNSLGVRGVSPNFVGVVGISDNSHGLYGFTASPNGVGLVGENLGGGLAGYFNGSVQITGTLFVGGNKAAVIPMYDGTKAMVYCQESPEPWFEDFGRAQLVGGVAQVQIEREFATLIAGGDYLVFTHPEGDTRGLFVTRRTSTGFEVREAQGGTSSASFTYRVVTKRKDIEGRRFARVVDEQAKNLQALRAGAGVMDGRQTPNTPSQPVPPFMPAVPPVNPQPPSNTPAPGPAGRDGR